MMKLVVTCLFLLALLEPVTSEEDDCYGVQCADGAQCFDNKCKCTGDTPYGFGPFCCYESPSYICTLTCDPVVKVVDQASAGFLQRAKFDFPGFYLVFLALVNRPQPPPCLFGIYGTNSKYKAKVYMSRFEFYIEIGPYVLCFRVDAQVDENGVPEEYEVFHKYSLAINDPLTPGYPDDQSVVQTFQDGDFIIVVCLECGIHVKFRAYNHQLRHYVTSGLAIVVDTSKFPNIFYFEDGPSCLPPSQVGPTLEEFGTIYDIDPKYVLMHRAITTNIPQIHGETECGPTLRQTVQICQMQRGLFYQLSEFVFGNADFLRCYCPKNDPRAADSICLMADIASAICNKNVTLCEEIQSDLSVYNGGQPCPGSDFLNFDCPSLTQ